MTFPGRGGGAGGLRSLRPGRRTAWGWRHRYGWAPFAGALLAAAAGPAAATIISPAAVAAVAALIAATAVAVAGARYPAAADRTAAGMAAGMMLLVVAAGALRVAAIPAAIAGIVAAGMLRVRLVRDERVRDRLRRERIEGWWPEYAGAAGHPGVQLRGGRIEVADTGWRLALEVPWGDVAGPLVGSEERWISALHLHDAAVQIERDRNVRVAYLHVALRDPEPATAAEDDGARSVADVMGVGAWDDGMPLRVRLFVAKVGAVHALIVGATRAGKSGLINKLLWWLVRCRDVTLFGADGKGGAELDPWAACMEELVTEKDPEDFAAMMIGLRAVVDRRGELAAKMRWRVWKPSRRWPVIAVIVDESAEFFAAGRPYTREVRAAMESVARRGAAFGVFLVLATQYGLAGAVGGTTVRKQLGIRWCFRTNEGSEAGFALKNSRGANTVGIPRDRPGTGYVEGDEDDRGTMRGRTDWVTDEERDRTVAEWTPRRTPLDPESRAAYDEAIAAWVGDEDDVQAADVAPAAPPAADEVSGPALEVLNVARPRVRPVPPPPAPAGDPAEVFEQLLRDAGERGVSMREIKAAVGYDRTWIGEHLIGPATLDGEVERVGAGRNTRYRRVLVGAGV